MCASKSCSDVLETKCPTITSLPLPGAIAMNEKKFRDFFLVTVIPIFIILLFIYKTFGHGVIFENITLAPFSENPWLDPGASYKVNASMGMLVNMLLSNGEWPLWSDHVGIGTPLFSDPHNSFFSPFSLILYLLPTTHGWDLMTLVRLFTLITGSYFLFLKITTLAAPRQSTASLVALVAAILFGYSGHVFYFLNLFHLNSLAFFPLLLLGVIQTLEKEYRKGMFSIGIAFPLMVFGGGLLDTVLAGVFSAFILLVWLLQKLRKLRDCVPPLAWLLLFGLFALCFASIFILPYLDVRSIAIPTPAGRSSGVFNSYWYALGMFVKDLAITPPDASHYYMKYRQYLHIVCLPGLFFSLLVVTREGYRFSYILVGCWLFLLFYFFKLYGFPLLNFINQVPVLQDIRFVKYQGGMNLAYYLLSGVGTFFALTTTVKKEKAFFSALCLVAGLIPFLYLWHHQIPVNQTSFSYAAQPLTLFFLTSAFWFLNKEKFAHFAVRKLKVALIVLGLLLVGFQIDLDLSLPRAGYRELFPDDPLKARVKELADGSRVMPMLHGGPRKWAAYGVHDVTNISVIFTQRYLDLFKTYIEKNNCWHSFVLCSSDPATLDFSLLAYIGTRFVVMKQNKEEALSRNREQDFREVESSYEAKIIELSKTVPIASISNSVINMDDRSVLNIIKDPSKRDTSVVYLEDADDLEIPGEPKLKAHLDLLERKNGQLHAKVTVNTKSLFVYNNQFYPGWKAYVDGKQVPIIRANYLFQAVVVPAGVHEVQFVFFPDSLIWGMVLFFLAGVLIVILSLKVFSVKKDSDNAQHSHYESCSLCGGDSSLIRPFATRGDESTSLLKCSGCHCEFLSPQPSDDWLGEEYSGYYQKRKSTVTQTKKSWFSKLLKSMEIDLNNKRVLELGGGEGDCAAALTSIWPKSQMTVVESNPQCINFYDAIPCTLSNQSVEDFLSLNAPQSDDEKFDIVLMFDLIEHLRAPKENLRRLSEVQLKPGATLLATFPNSDSLSRRWFHRLWPQYKIEHLWYFSRTSVEKIAAELGLEIITLKSLTKKLPPDYLLTVGSHFGPDFVQFLSRLIIRILPKTIKKWPLSFKWGEWQLVAQKL